MPDLDVTGLFKEIAQGDSVSYGEEAVWLLIPCPRRASDYRMTLLQEGCHPLLLKLTIEIIGIMMMIGIMAVVVSW